MKKFYIVLCVMSVVFRWCTCNSDYGIDGYGTTGSAQYCADLNPQNHLDISQITGMWYGSEVLQHRDSIDGEMMVESCVTVHLKETTHEQITTRSPTDSFDSPYYNSERGRPRQHQYNYLRLIWEERGTLLEYSLRYNTTRRGFWICSPPLADAQLNSPYTQFTGTIQVMKAVGTHLVLTFCQTSPSPQLFSVTLSRKPNMITHEDIQSVRNLLRRRGLSTSSIRKVCSTGGASAVRITLSSILLIAFTTLFH
ncbi:hypothetical protein Bhyg_14603 [Pseudolycoriella hygida]|uniref:Uncharacterized protein n=1 Tax=Pseudolycoriella hygida TaxID=35572 RepID=A0A9Q0MQF1_9DIPT|nr:hypothetical protein Bhyg_14603 [Pseudolycoriella hygida]